MDWGFQWAGDCSVCFRIFDYGIECECKNMRFCNCTNLVWIPFGLVPPWCYFKAYLLIFEVERESKTQFFVRFLKKCISWKSCWRLRNNNIFKVWSFKIQQKIDSKTTSAFRGDIFDIFGDFWVDFGSILSSEIRKSRFRKKVKKQVEKKRVPFFTLGG